MSRLLYKVYSTQIDARGKKYHRLDGSCRFPEDAAVLVAVIRGGVIKADGVIVWREGSPEAGTPKGDGYAADSYDNAAIIMRRRIEGRDEAREARERAYPERIVYLSKKE